MTAFLGIDGGGSHTRAVMADARGLIIGAGVGASINPRHHDASTVRDRLRELVRRARGSRLEPPSAAFLSLGGISTRADAEAVEAIAAEIDELRGAKVKVANDAIAALVGGLAGRPGMVLIAGTGSACYGVAGERPQPLVRRLGAPGGRCGKRVLDCDRSAEGGGPRGGWTASAERAS